MFAATGNTASIDSYSAYAQSFGNLPAETVYSKVDVKSLCTQDPKYTVDLRPSLSSAMTKGMESLSQKAMTTTSGGAGTAGQAMIPVYVDPRVTDLTRKETPLVEIIPRVTNMGVTADYNQITAKGGGFTRGEDAALSEQDNTYARQSTPIKYLYAVGRVTGQSIAATPAYILQGMQPTGGAVGGFNDVNAPNSTQIEVLAATRAIRELEENLIISGNATTSAISGNPNGTEFDGIIQTLGATNTVDKNTSALALEDLDVAVQNAYDDGGRPNLAVCSSGVFTDLLALLTAKIGYLQPTQQVFWGFSTIVLNTMVGQVPVIPSRYLSNTSGSKSIYFLDLNVIEMRVLQDLTYEKLAKTNDSEKFMLKIYEALIIKAPQFCASVTEIA